MPEKPFWTTLHFSANLPRNKVQHIIKWMFPSALTIYTGVRCLYKYTNAIRLRREVRTYLLSIFRGAIVKRAGVVDDSVLFIPSNL